MKKMRIEDVIAIANDLKSQFPFCQNSKLISLTFNKYQIWNFFKKLPVKRSGGFLHKIDEQK